MELIVVIFLLTHYPNIPQPLISGYLGELYIEGPFGGAMENLTQSLLLVQMIVKLYLIRTQEEGRRDLDIVPNPLEVLTSKGF
jgi:hypothetical protein